MNVLYLTDLIGTGVFAISGTLAALHKQKDHDILTLFIFAFVTAVGEVPCGMPSFRRTRWCG